MKAIPGIGSSVKGTRVSEVSATPVKMEIGSASAMYVVRWDRVKCLPHGPSQNATPMAAKMKSSMS